MAKNKKRNARKAGPEAALKADPKGLKGASGIARAAFFAAGGTAKQWSMLAGAGSHGDARAEADRTRCRGPIGPDD